MHGMPEARYTFVPQPVMGKSAELAGDWEYDGAIGPYISHIEKFRPEFEALCRA